MRRISSPRQRKPDHRSLSLQLRLLRPPPKETNRNRLLPTQQALKPNHKLVPKGFHVRSVRWRGLGSPPLSVNSFRHQSALTLIELLRPSTSLITVFLGAPSTCFCRFSSPRLLFFPLYAIRNSWKGCRGIFFKPYSHGLVRCWSPELGSMWTTYRPISTSYPFMQ